MLSDWCSNWWWSMLLCHPSFFIWRRQQASPYTDLCWSCLPGGQRVGRMLIQCTGATNMGKQKQLYWFTWLSWLCFASVYVSLWGGCLPANRYLSASPKKTCEDLHPLSKYMKVMNKNPSLFHQAQPHSAISQWLTVNTAAPEFHSVMWQSEVVSHSGKKTDFDVSVSDMSECFL